MAVETAKITVKVDTRELREELEALGRSFEVAGLTAAELSERIAKGYKFWSADDSKKVWSGSITTPTHSWELVPDGEKYIVRQKYSLEEIPIYTYEQLGNCLLVCLDDANIVNGETGEAWGHVIVDGGDWGYKFTPQHKNGWLCEETAGWLIRLLDRSFAMVCFVR